MPASTDLCFRPAADLARSIAAREISVVEVMEAHLARIEEVNPAVNAIVTLLPMKRAGVRRRPTRRWRAAKRSGRCTGCR